MLCTRSGHRFAWGVAACLVALGGSLPAQAAEPQFTPVAQAAPGVLQTAPPQPKGALSEQARQRLADHAARPAPVSGRVANEAAPALSTARQVSPNHLEPLWGQDAVPAPKGDALAKPQAAKVVAPSAVPVPRTPKAPQVPPVPSAAVVAQSSRSGKAQPTAPSVEAGAKGREARSARAESRAGAAKPKATAHARKHAPLQAELAGRTAKASAPQAAHRKLGSHAEAMGDALQPGKVVPKRAGKTHGVAAVTQAKPAKKLGVFHVKHGARGTAAKAAAAKTKSAKSTGAKPSAAKTVAVKPAGKGHASPAKASGKTKLAKGSKGTKASAAKGAKSAQGKHPGTRHRG